MYSASRPGIAYSPLSSCKHTVPIYQKSMLISGTSLCHHARRNNSTSPLANPITKTKPAPTQHPQMLLPAPPQAHPTPIHQKSGVPTALHLSAIGPRPPLSRRSFKPAPLANHQQLHKASKAPRCTMVQNPTLADMEKRIILSKIEEKEKKKRYCQVL